MVKKLIAFSVFVLLAVSVFSVGAAAQNDDSCLIGCQIIKFFQGFSEPKITGGAITSVSACGSLGVAGEVYTLTQDVSSAGTCFTISAGDVTLDCQGHTITFATDVADTVRSKSGVVISAPNANVKNCNIIQGSSVEWKHGIYLSSSSVANTLIENNYIETFGEFARGIVGFYDSGGTSIINNVVKTNGQVAAIALQIQKPNANIIGNEILALNSVGLYLSGAGGSYYHNILNNTVVGGYEAVSLRVTNDVHFEGNKFYSSNTPILISSGQNNVFVRNEIHGSSPGFFDGNCVNTYIYDNIINVTSLPGYGGSYAGGLNWNIAKQSGRNIVNGIFLGGNFWMNPTGTGYSEVCDDIDNDGICDVPYELRAGSDTDYFPLSYPPCSPDQDGDWYYIDGGACGPIDCNDNDPTINPGMTDVCDSVDNNCDGVVDSPYASYDCGVGECLTQSVCVDGVESCTPLPAGAENTNALCDDGLDNDCDGSIDFPDDVNSCSIGTGGGSTLELCSVAGDLNNDGSTSILDAIIAQKLGIGFSATTVGAGCERNIITLN